MILVIIAVQPVAADRLEVFKAINEFPNGDQVVAVVGIIDGIGLWHTANAAILDIRVASQADAIHFSLSKLDELCVRHVPKLVPFGAEVLETQARLGGIGDHFGAPVLEVLNPTHLDIRIVDVDPVVREKLGLVHYQTDCQEVTIMDFLCGL